MARGQTKARAKVEPVEGPWDLPDGWHWERLDGIAKVIAGQSPPSSTYNDAGIGLPFYQGKSEFGSENPAVRKWCASPSKVAHRNDVLISVRAPVGPTNIATEECGIGRGLAAIRPKPMSTSTRWLRHWLVRTEKVLASHGTGTTFAAITGDVLRQHLCPVAPIDLQAAIVARIDALFAEIDAGEAALAEARSGVETYRKSLLKAAVTGELTVDWRRDNPPQESGADLLRRILNERRARWNADPKNAKKKYVEPVGPDTDDLPELPAGWVWASLEQIAFISGGATVDQKRKPADPIEVPYLRVANVQRGALDLSKMKTIIIDRSKLPDLALAPGDILLNEGGDRDKVGRGWIWEGQLDVCAHQNHVFKARPANDTIEPRLVSMYLNELGKKFFLDESKQTTNLASISRTKVASAPVAIPPPNEAKAILQAIHYRIDATIEAPEIERAELAASQLRQSILAAAFRGELTP